MKKSPEKLSIGFLFDDTLDSNDGVAQYVKVMGAWHAAQGHKVTYLVGQSRTTEWAGGQVISLSRNLKVRWGGNRVSISLLSSSRHIRRVLGEHHFDVVHVQVPYSPFMARRVISRLPEDTAVVGSFHIMPAHGLATWGLKLLRIMYGRTLRRFDVMLAVSKPAAAFAKQTLGVEAPVSPNAVELKRFAASKKKRIPGRVVFLGRLVERKGCKQLIRAFLELADSTPECSLTIAGDGPQRHSLEDMVKKAGLDKQVRFLGYIDEVDKPDVLASAEIACFPSLYGESFGIVLIEAMAAGSGVVLGGNNPGYTSILGPKPELLFNPSDTGAFAAKLKEFLVNKRLIADTNKWQRDYVRRFDVNKVGTEVMAYYRQAIAKRRQTIDN